MNGNAAQFLDVDLMVAADIDGLYAESVRIHLSQGSFDVSSRQRGVELLPPRYAATHTSSTPAVACIAPLSLHLSVLVNVSAVREGGNKKGVKTSQYKAAFKISAPLKAIPP